MQLSDALFVQVCCLSQTERHYEMFAANFLCMWGIWSVLPCQPADAPHFKLIKLVQTFACFCESRLTE